MTRGKPRRKGNKIMSNVDNIPADTTVIIDGIAFDKHEWDGVHISELERDSFIRQAVKKMNDNPEKQCTTILTGEMLIVVTRFNNVMRVHDTILRREFTQLRDIE